MPEPGGPSKTALMPGSLTSSSGNVLTEAKGGMACIGMTGNLRNGRWLKVSERTSKVGRSRDELMRDCCSGLNV